MWCATLVVGKHTRFRWHVPLGQDRVSAAAPVAGSGTPPRRSGDSTRRSLPNVPSIFGDGSVAGKLAGACDIEDRLGRPAFPVSVEPAHPFMCVAVRLEIG